MTVTYILLAILALSVLVMIHELGHFVAGRLLGFTILEFAIGMGPKLVGFKKNGIEYNLRCLPIGGMCRFFGEDEGASDSRCFNAQKPWKRAIVIAAGPIMNFVLAFILGMILFMGWGEYDPSRIVISEVTKSSAAEAAGMEAGDEILSMNGTAITSYDAMKEILTNADPDSLSVQVLRDGDTVDLHLSNLTLNTESGSYQMGVIINYARVKSGFFGAIGQSFSYCGEMTALIWRSLKMLFTGEAGFSDMAGAVGVVQLLGKAAKTGFDLVLSLCIMLSMNLGIFNLLPIPALDGGRLAFIVVEWIRGKPVPPEKEGVVHLIGFALLMVLMVAVTFNDILRIIRG